MPGFYPVSVINCVQPVNYILTGYKVYFKKVMTIMMKIFCFIIFCVMVLSGCSPREVGNKMDIKQLTSLSMIKKHSLNYLGQFVKIQGKVVEESQKQIWITLQSEDKEIVMVNYEEENFDLPEKLLNRRIEIMGQFVEDRGGYMIKGKYLKIIE